MKYSPTTIPRYNDAFWDYQRGRAYNAADLEVGGGEGAIGYQLPSEAEAKFRKWQDEMNVFRRISTVVYTDVSGKKINIVPPTGPAAFVVENGIIPEEDVSFLSYTVESRKITKIAKVSTELVRDAGFDIVAALASDFGREFGKAEEQACVGGDGVTQPYGIIHETEGAEVGVTVTGNLTFDNAKALFFSLGAEYRRNAVWLMSDETAMYLRTLKDGNGAYLWRDFDDTILSRPVFTSPYMPGIGSGVKPILFGDFRYYWLIEGGSITLQPLHEKYARSGVTGFFGIEFVDGRLLRKEAVKALAIT